VSEKGAVTDGTHSETERGVYIPSVHPHTMYSDVVVPTDGSETIETVIEHTKRVTDPENGTVHILSVVDDQVLLTLAKEMQDEVLADLHEDSEHAIETAREQFDETEMAVTTAIREGKPATEIISYVEDEGIDLVTMGTRADDYTENMLGSTAQEVVRHSPVPVLTVNVE
jgi:nucleotide-binding universal stress UspA family protein